MSDMDEREYEARLQHRLEILKKQIDLGKLKIKEGLTLIDSLKKVKYATDGSVDLSTVDASVRSAALLVGYLHDKEETKTKHSLLEIQGTYFHFLETNFGIFYEGMLKKGLTPHDVAMSFIQNDDRINHINEVLPELLKVIQDFWTDLEEVTHYHLEDLTNISKGVFGGDLFPSNNENIASKCSMYMDTIILPCPFMRSLGMFEHWDKKQKAYYCIKHALNVLKYKTLAIEPIYPPIIAILPDRAAFEKEERDFFSKLGTEDGLIHGRKMFGMPFDSYDEMREFAATLTTIEQVEESVVDKERVLFDTEWNGSLGDQIKRALSESIEAMKQIPPGLFVASLSTGRMAVCNELIVKSSRLNGVPIIDAPTSWKYFNWKLEYDSIRASEILGTGDLHVYRALQSLSETEGKWIGNIPPEAIIELRTSGAIGEIRSILNKGLIDIIEIDPLNFKGSSDCVFNNLNNAMVKHRQAIDELTAKKWKFAATSISSWLVNGSVAVAAAATGQPLLALAPMVVSQMIPSSRLDNIPGTILDFMEQKNNLKCSPIGMLFNYYED